VSEEIAFAFEGLSVDVRPVETVLHGDNRVADLGLELIEVRRLPDAPADSPAASAAPR
jgi:hypothetical protein